MTAIGFDRVTLALGGRTVLSSVDFSIRSGEFVGLLGPNGAGKTTLLRAILGLVPATSGTINVLGQPARRGNRDIGYMPQHRQLNPSLSLTGWDYVASAAAGWRWGMPRLGPADRREVAWALDTVDATALATRPLSSLSGGERQRLLISQALLGRPKLLLLDEPLISLDPGHQQAIIALTKRLQAEMGLTVIFSAHELNPLLDAMDRVLYLGDGRALLGAVSDVVTGPVLSGLYGTPIEVLRVGSRIFVLNGSVEEGHDAHRHDHAHDHPHAHAPAEPGKGFRSRA